MALKAFLKRIWVKPPQVFPFIAVFHVAMLMFALYIYGSEPLPSPIWMQVIWVLTYTILWLYCCDLKKWALYGYLFVALLNISLRFLIKDSLLIDLYLDAIFPMDLLFSFFLLFHFRKFS